MATLYGHRRGKSRSHPPIEISEKLLKRKPEEIYEIILKLHKKGFDEDKIGLILRDSYGVPSVKKITGKKIKKILEEHGIRKKPIDIMNLIKRAVKLKKHLEKNKKDMTAKRGLQLVESKIHRLEKYYKKKGILPSDWKYTQERI